MAIYQTQTLSFRAELFQGVHDLLTDTIKMALYTNNASLSYITTVYSTADEVVGTGYSSGGIVLTGVTVSSSTTDNIAYVNFDSATWNPATFTCRGALIYNASKGDKSIAVLDFGADKSTTTSFTVQMPANGPTTALIRSA